MSVFQVEFGGNTSGLDSAIGRAISLMGRVDDRARQMGRSLEASFRQGGQSISNFSSSLTNRLAAAYDRADERQQRFGRSWGRMADGLQSAGRTMTAAVTLPMTLMAAQVGKTYMEIDALERSVKRYGMSLKDIQTIAKAPGLGLQEAAEGSVRLLSVRYNADLTRRSLLALGNALSLDGKGKAELDGITLALSQMKGKGKVQAEELNQIAERLPSIRQTVQDAFGTGDTEQLQKMGISADVFLERITKQLETLPKAANSPKLAFENLTDSIKLGTFEIGRAADNAIGFTDVMNSMGAGIQKVVSGFVGLPPGIQQTAFVIAGLAAAAGPASLALGTLIKLGPSLSAGFSALLSPTTAIIAGLIAISYAGYKMYDSLRSVDDLADRQGYLADMTKRVETATKAETDRVNELIGVARDKARADGERKRAIEELNKLNPQFLGFLNLENINTQEATKAANDYATALQAVQREKLALLDIDQKASELEAAKKEKPEVSMWNVISSGLAFSEGDGQMVTAEQMAQRDKDRDIAALKRELLNARRERRRGIDVQNELGVKPGSLDGNGGKPPVTPPVTGAGKAEKTQLEKDEDALKKLEKQINDLRYRGLNVPVILEIRRDILKENIAFAKAEGRVVNAGDIKPMDRIQQANDPAKTQGLTDAVREMNKPVALDVIDRQQSLERLKFAIQSITNATGAELDGLTNSILTKMSGAVTADTMNTLTEEIYGLGDQIEQDLGVQGDLAYEAAQGFLGKLQEGFKADSLGDLFQSSGIKSQMDSYIKSLPEKFQEIAGLGPKFAEAMADMAKTIEAAGQDAQMSAAGSLGNFVGGMVSGQQDGMQQLVQGLFGVLADFLGQLARARLAAALALQTSAFLTGPGAALALIQSKGLFTSAVALQAAAGVVRGIGSGLASRRVALAKGGAAYGPTNALIGEYVGAANDPEYVERLSPLTGRIGKAVRDNMPEASTRLTRPETPALMRQQVRVELGTANVRLDANIIDIALEQVQKGKRDIWGNS